MKKNQKHNRYTEYWPVLKKLLFVVVVGILIFRVGISGATTSEDTLMASIIPTPYQTGTPTWTPTPVGTIIPTWDPTPIKTATPTLTTTPIRSSTPIRTITPIRSSTPVRSATPIRSITPTPYGTPTPTVSATVTPISTSTPTPSPTPAYNVYYGHLHNHSYVSDGTGTMEQAYTYARYTAGLDFFSLADHAQDISATEWTDLKNIANNHNQDGAFVTFWGFEWSHSTQGHVAVINTMDYCSSSNSGTDTFLELVTWISSRDGVAFFNHPGRQDSTGQEFKHFSSIYCSKFVGMELWNKNDAFNNYYYNDGYYAIDANKGYFDEAIYHNWKIGASGADDNHRATWGTDNQYRLAVLAPAKTRAAIYDGLKSRRFYSTMDKNLVLYFEINGAPMGSDIGLGTYPAVIRLSDGDYETFTKIDLLKNGAVLYSWTPNSPNPFISQNITTVCGDYFYVRVRQADGNEAISSPIFVN